MHHNVFIPFLWTYLNFYNFCNIVIIYIFIIHVYCFVAYDGLCTNQITSKRPHRRKHVLSPPVYPSWKRPHWRNIDNQGCGACLSFESPCFSCLKNTTQKKRMITLISPQCNSICTQYLCLYCWVHIQWDCLSLLPE